MAPRTPLFRPNAYFATRSDVLFLGLTVFALYVVETLVLFYALMYLLLDQIRDAPPALESAMNEVFSTVAVFTVFIAVVALLVVAAIVHYGSGGTDTDGTFADAVSVAGWAYAPELVTMPLSYLAARREIATLTFDGSDPATLQRQFEAVQQSVGPASFVILLATVVWSVYILAAGTAGTHDVDVRKTILPALLVGFGSFLLGVT
ncbi:YIP1 family protein [Natronorubrum halophilum]|uniref:YIP1 family protein n=1 Tax=Natronorubrum halophilum TaxID=1702106 RepID=UPI00148513B0|nr:YIP1 family protein [Natronorubrum halophilum]